MTDQNPTEPVLNQSRSYLNERIRNLENTKNYHLAKPLIEQLQSLSSYQYEEVVGGNMNAFMQLLKDAQYFETEYDVNGAVVWLPNGVKLKQHFVSEVTKYFDRDKYEEYLFPSLISTANFTALSERVYDFKKQVLVVDGHDTQYVLKPTGEPTIYPVLARWLKDGVQQLPVRLYQTGPYFRYKSSPHAYLRPVESSLMIEGHGLFATRAEMEKEFGVALKTCAEWTRLLCLSPYQVSRPLDFNKPVSEKTVGFDVVLKSGKTIQTSIAYLQGQVFSKAFSVEDPKTSQFTYHITYGLTERNVFTTLYAHADSLGLRLPTSIAPCQVLIVQRDAQERTVKAANDMHVALKKMGIRSQVRSYDNEQSIHRTAVIQGVPLQIMVDQELVERDSFEVFDRRTYTVMVHSDIATVADMLNDGDATLLAEQETIKKQHTVAFANHPTTKSEDMCRRVVVHEKRECLEGLHGLGVGEYIGTDQNEVLDKPEPCYTCEQACSTVGYVARRI